MSSIIIFFLSLCSLFCIILASQMSMLGFQTESQITIEKLRCLQSKYLLEETFIQLYNDGDIISSVDLHSLKQVFIQPHAVIILLPTDTHNSAWAISKWQQHILTHNYRSLWITWTYGGGYKIDCLGVWNIISALQKLTTKLGIFMSEQRWKDNEYLNFGYCQNLNRFSLFAESVDQFKPFNSWNNYELKIGLIAKGICQVDQIEFIRKQ